MCAWKANSKYEDGSHAYILNAGFTRGNAGAEVLNLLRYIDSGYRGKLADAPSEYVARLNRAVEKVKANEELEGTYMTFAMKLQDTRYEGWQEGRKEDQQEGRKDNLLTNVKAMMKNLGIPAEKAMEILEVPANDRDGYLKLLGL